MAARMPKNKNTVRAHVQMPPAWKRLIDRAARELNMSRSNFIANAAKTAAEAALVQAKK
jgi:uncharacterized protein (DUF1778 family)